MPAFLAVYIHNINPYVVHFYGRFGIRWYGLAYVAGFVAGWFLLRWFVRLKACELKETEVADFMTLCALFGVMLGGRLGYQLFYNLHDFLSNPLEFFRFLQGGMSSHGGILGVTIFSLVYAKIKKISWTGLGDNIVTVAPVGLFFGRIANFINGELYGRPTGSRFAMKFPDELNEVIRSTGQLHWRYSLEKLQDFAEKCGSVAPGLKASVADAIASGRTMHLDPHGAVASAIIQTAHRNAEVRQLLGSILTPRHPSQLYEALIEGLLLFLTLLAVRLKWKNLYHGVLTGLFFILYACGRIAVEQFREPDAGLILGMTRGQFYSTFMIVVGAGFLIHGFVLRKRNQIRTQN